MLFLVDKILLRYTTPFFAGTQVTASMDTKIHPTICHSKCAVILAEGSGSKRCCECQKYHKTLHSMLSRQQKACSSSKTAPSSHVNYRYLTTSERMTDLNTNLQRQTKRQVDHLSAKIAENTEHKGVIVDEGIHNDLTEIVNEHTSKVNATS